MPGTRPGMTNVRACVYLRIILIPIFKQPRLIVLAAEIRASFSKIFETRSHERERSAVRRMFSVAAPAKEPHRLARPVRLTALHPALLDDGTPLPRRRVRAH